jgi:hypothetical protein
MKMLNLSIPFTFAFALVAFLSAGCSDSTSKIAGTAEEQNELAEAVSSSSADEELPISSSAVQSSSSAIVSSSSSSNGQTAPVSELDSNSLSYYLLQYGITDAAFDSKVFASTITYKENTSAPPQGNENPNDHDGDTSPGTVAAATEFDGQGFHPFVKQNIAALGHYFPEAYEKFPQLIDDIKNDNVQEGCGLYMLNIYADSRYVGFILTEVNSSSVTVLDIKADACQTGAGVEYARFLVSYCGDLDKNPEVVHKVVEADIPKDQCPQASGQEWVK